MPGATQRRLELGKAQCQCQIRGATPQWSPEGHRIYELEAEVASLRQALLVEQVSGQSRSQELNAHLRQQARRALDYQREEFENVAQRHEQVSADATAAAVIRERSDQRTAQHQQLDAYRRPLAEVESNVS